MPTDDKDNSQDGTFSNTLYSGASGSGIWGFNNPSSSTSTNTSSNTTANNDAAHFPATAASATTNPYLDNDTAHNTTAQSTSNPYLNNDGAHFPTVTASTTTNPYLNNDIAHNSGTSSSSPVANQSLNPQGGSVAVPNNAVAATPAAPMFTLIKGDGAEDVYVLNNRGERFHVSGTLMNEMIAGGSWSEPVVKPQAEVDAMALRYTVDSVANLNTINNATFTNGDGNHTYMLIKGDATDFVPDTQLVGNGRAIYAVDDRGQKFHVTGEAFSQLGAVPIANITQAAVDSNSVAGGMVAPGGTLSTTTDANLDPALTSAMPFNLLTQPIDPLLNQAVASANNVLSGTVPHNDNAATPATLATPADPGNTSAVPATPATPSSQSQPQDEALAVQQSAQGTGEFNFVRNDADGAIYAVNAGGQKFHITAELWNSLTPDQQHFRTATAEELNYPNGSNVDLTNMDQLRSININAGKEFRLVKGNGNSMDASQLEGNGDAVYALTSTGDRYHVTADLAQKMGGAYSNIETLDQGVVDKMGTMKGSINTVAELNKAVKTSAAGFNGDTSAIPGGVPPMPGYVQQ